ncbi:PadR family transcriptional regulator [Streptomyces sp. NPDC001858]
MSLDTCRGSPACSRSDGSDKAQHGKACSHDLLPQVRPGGVPAGTGTPPIAHLGSTNLFERQLQHRLRAGEICLEQGARHSLHVGFRAVKLTPQMERVLEVLLQDPTAPRYGYELMKSASLASGTLYPILNRLLDHEWVVSAWETPKEGQRPRRYYKLTPHGTQAARLQLAQSHSKRPWERPVPSVHPIGGGA